MIERKVEAYGIRLSHEEGGVEVGHAYLYVMGNDLHERPFGLLEDVHVDERFRGRGIGAKLVREIIEVARREGCYKLLATSRYGTAGENPLHTWYTERFGFKDHGKELRLDL